MTFNIDPELLSAVIFYIILAIVIIKYRKRFTVMQKIFFVYKSKKPLALMKKLAEHRVFFKIFSTIAIPAAVFAMIFIGQVLLENLLKIAAGVGGVGVSLAIPGVRIPGSPIFIPFWYGIISIGILAVVHEFSHGIVAAMEGVRLKSAGFGFLLILPLAFVELDEKQMMKKPRIARLRIASAGAFANVALWFVLSLLLIFILYPAKVAMLESGVKIANVEDGLPAQLAGLTAGDLVIAINNYTIKNIIDFASAMSGILTNETIVVQTTNNVFFVTTTANPNNGSIGYLGVGLSESTEPNSEAKANFGSLSYAPLWIISLVQWVALLNLAVGVMNFLPIWAIDGSRIAYDLFGYVIKNEKVLFVLLNLIFAFYTALLIFNLIGPFLVSLF